MRQGSEVVEEKEQTQKSGQKVWLGFHSTGHFKPSQQFQSFLGPSQKPIGSFARLETPRNAHNHSHGLQKNSEMITVFLASLACLNYIFVILIMFAS